MPDSLSRITSDRLSNMLARHEGVRRHVYLCPAGHETIGVGRNISASGLGLSDDEIAYMLSNDIARCREELRRAFFPWFEHLDPVRADALVDLCFNLGLTRLRGFKKMLAALERGDRHTAADELLDSGYAHQVGNRATELANMFRTGEYRHEP